MVVHIQAIKDMYDLLTEQLLRLGTGDITSIPTAKRNIGLIIHRLIPE